MATTRYVLRSGAWRARGRAALGEVPQSGIPTTPTPWLPFNMATREAIVAADRKIFAHAFCDYAIGGDQRSNSTTWYTNNMPGGTQNQTYGGFLRDRPLQPPGVTRPRTETSWWILDRAYEVLEARLAGFHGFMVDWLNLNDGTGDNRTGQLREYCEAVRYLGVQDDFKIIIMPDGTTSIGDGGNYANVKAKLKSLIDDYPDVLYRHTDGRYVVFVYSPETTPSTTSGSTRVFNISDTAANRDYWETFMEDMEADGYPIAWGMCYQRNWVTDPNTSGATADLAGVFMLSRWGDRDFATSNNSNNQNRGAPAYCHSTFNKPWMHPVSNQDNRSNSRETPKFWESGNTRNLVNSWMAAIDGDAEWVQVPTWNDLREHAHMIPTYNHGHCWLDISAFFQFRWLFGEWPTVERDCIFLSHRIHRTDDYTVTGAQTNFMTKASAAPTQPTNLVEVLCFLTSPDNSQVDITINGVTDTRIPDSSSRVVSGLNSLHAWRVEMPSTGTVGATIKKGGVTVATITSPHTITNTPVAQDMHYRVVGSIRGVES